MINCIHIGYMTKSSPYSCIQGENGWVMTEAETQVRGQDPCELVEHLCVCLRNMCPSGGRLLGQQSTRWIRLITPGALDPHSLNHPARQSRSASGPILQLHPPTPHSKSSARFPAHSSQTTFWVLDSRLGF